MPTYTRAYDLHFSIFQQIRNNYCPRKNTKNSINSDIHNQYQWARLPLIPNHWTRTNKKQTKKELNILRWESIFWLGTGTPNMAVSSWILRFELFPYNKWISNDYANRSSRYKQFGNETIFVRWHNLIFCFIIEFFFCIREYIEVEIYIHDCNNTIN